MRNRSRFHFEKADSARRLALTGEKLATTGMSLLADKSLMSSHDGLTDAESADLVEYLKAL